MLRHSGVWLVLIAAILPLTARAQWGPAPLGPCGWCGLPFVSCGCPAPVCGGCQLPPVNCCCPPPPQPVFQTQLRPVFETRMRPQQVTTCQPVVQTRVRREACQITVPVTVNTQVSEVVLVPQVVTRTVPRTVYQQQVAYRDVPYQVVHNVPRVHTQFIPEQTVRYMPETRMIGVQPSGCCGPVSIPAAVPPTVLPPNMPVPSGSATPTAPISASPTAASPTNRAAGSQWQKIPQRAESPESGIELQSYQRVTRTPRRLFTPVAPSAATVWQAQSRF